MRGTLREATGGKASRRMGGKPRLSTVDEAVDKKRCVTTFGRQGRLYQPRFFRIKPNKINEDVVVPGVRDTGALSTA